MPADPDDRKARAREKLIGLGKRSISKSYYPELKKRLDELEHFRALLDRVSDAIFVVDPDSGDIIDTSGSTETMLGCAPADLAGTPFKDLLPSHIRRHAHNLYNTKNRSVSIETELRCATTTDAAPVPVEISLQLVSHRGTRTAIIVARDISERKRNEEVLRKSHDLLEIRVRERTRELDRANRAKSEFLSMVSHELRTPLTSVLGFTKIIRKKLDKTIFPAIGPVEDGKLSRAMTRIRSNIDIITAEGDRLTALINDVLDLAKLEANKVEFRMEDVAPEEFIERSVQATAALFEDSEVALLLDIEPGLPPVRGDLDRLIQVMVNLFSNGVKFTEEGTITCSAHLVGSNVRVSVADTGIGIPESLHESVFEEFAQGDDRQEDRPKGTGLGLAICRGIVHGHNGHIWVESEVGVGSTFIFTLPALAGE